MNLPTVKQLKYLSELAEHRHFGRAAQACFISQSALSTGINELEQNMGVSLFERGPSLLLTPIGESLVGDAREILNQLYNFSERAKQAQGNFKNDLRLGVITTIAPFLLPKISKKIQQKYRNNKLYIREDLSPRLIEMLNKGQLDIILFALPYDTSNLHVEHLFKDELLLCLAKNHPLVEKSLISISDLKQQDFLLLEDGHCLNDQMLKAFNVQANELTVPYQATSLNTIVQMVVNNVGVTLLPNMAVEGNITRHTDAVIRKVDTSVDVSRCIALAWRKNSPRAEEFEELGELISEQKMTLNDGKYAIETK